jgi:hypothetical protein
MHLRLKSVAVAAAVSLLPLTALAATAGSADAATTLQSQVSIDVYATSGMVGGSQDISGAVKLVGDDGSHYPDGVSYLQWSTDGGHTWANLASDTDPGFSYFPSVNKLIENAEYRIYYAGGTDSSDGTVYAPAYSSPVAVHVTRQHSEKLKDKGHGHATKMLYTGKISGWVKKKVTIQVAKKPKGKWKKYKVTKTSKKGAYSVAMKAPSTKKSKLYFRAVIPGDAHYTQSYGLIAYTYWRMF